MKWWVSDEGQYLGRSGRGADRDRGSIHVAGKDYAGVPPEDRPSAMVFQNYALWPTMTVEGNVSFPLRVRKVAKDERISRVERALAMVNLGDKAKRRPARLSGGEQQRVSLARALVQEPSLLLLDEPLSNLDAKLRVQVREDIRRIQQDLGITTVIVTHDQDEALAISDRIAVMNAGRIEQYTDPITLYHRPATLFVAGFIGDMTFHEVSLAHVDGVPVLNLGDHRLPFASATTDAAGSYTAGIRPEQVQIVSVDEPNSARGVVQRLTPKGYQLEAVIAIGDSLLRGLVPVEAATVGREVGVRIGEVLLYADGKLVSDAPVEDAAQ